MPSTPNILFDYVVASQAQKELTVNSDLNALDFLVQASVINTTLSTPPARLSNGDIYIVAGNPNSAWSGQANNIAAYYSGWIFKTPKAGWVVWAKNLSRFIYFNGTSWQDVTIPPLSGKLNWSPSALAAGASVISNSITVTGASLGAFVSVSAPSSLLGLIATAYVTGAGMVVINLYNPTANSITPPPGNWNVRLSNL